MNTTKRLARFETAQEALGMLMAARSELIYQERKKAEPDEGKISAWGAEMEALATREDALRFDDAEEIERVIAECAVEARAIYTR